MRDSQRNPDRWTPAIRTKSIGALKGRQKVECFVFHCSLNMQKRLHGRHACAVFAEGMGETYVMKSDYSHMLIFQGDVSLLEVMN